MEEKKKKRKRGMENEEDWRVQDILACWVKILVPYSLKVSHLSSRA
jgi:hypothetical protein